MTEYTYPAGTVATALSAPFGVLIRDRDGRWLDPRDGVAWGNQTDDTIYTAVERVKSWAVAFQPGLIGQPATETPSATVTKPTARERHLLAKNLTPYIVPDSPKMLRETLCVAQSCISNGPDDPRKREHLDRLQRLIDECDRHRPLGVAGKHGDLHTPTCGCER